METEDAEDHGHLLPAVRDWPRGYGEASWWPFFTAVGLAIVYLGATVYTVGKPTDALSPTVGLYLFGAGLALTGVGMLAWIYQAFVQDFWGQHSPTGGLSLQIGMLLFLATDVATFGALFAYYFFIRVGHWQASYLPRDGLLSGLLVANTVVLLLSSFALRWTEVQIERNRHRRFVQGVVLTFLLGLGFVVGQAIEYYGYVVHEGFTLTSGIFASGFFALTGFHGLHVVFGLFLLAILALRGAYGQYDEDRHVSVTTVSWYWHFISAGWLFFVAVIYIGSTLGTSFSPF